MTIWRVTTVLGAGALGLVSAGHLAAQESPSDAAKKKAASSIKAQSLETAQKVEASNPSGQRKKAAYTVTNATEGAIEALGK